MTQNIADVRQSLSESVGRMKEKLGFNRLAQHSAGRDGVTRSTAEGEVHEGMKGDGIKAIQDENAQLNKMVGVCMSCDGVRVW